MEGDTGDAETLGECALGLGAGFRVFATGGVVMPKKLTSAGANICLRLGLTFFVSTRVSLVAVSVLGGCSGDGGGGGGESLKTSGRTVCK